MHSGGRALVWTVHLQERGERWTPRAWAGVVMAAYGSSLLAAFIAWSRVDREVDSSLSKREKV